jgi:hydroxymethylpyrimidine/phosphomethylpyrimidine kinase
MVSSAPLIAVIADKLHQYGAKHIVVDPVMGATSGAKLLKSEALQALTQQLLPLAEVCTPNIPEAEILSGMRISSAEDMILAAKIINSRYGCAVLCKGGHAVNDANDLLWKDGEIYWFHGKRINNPNTHGTGCTLSSAIASNLAKGQPLHQAVEHAKAYISGALASMLDLGKGSGPLNHAFHIEGRFAE